MRHGSRTLEALALVHDAVGSKAPAPASNPILHRRRPRGIRLVDHPISLSGAFLAAHNKVVSRRHEALRAHHVVVLIRMEENASDLAVGVLVKVEGVTAHVVFPHDRGLRAMAVAHRILLHVHLVQFHPFG